MYHAKIRMAHFVAQRIACGPLIAAAPVYGAEGVLVYRLGDDQIAHLPPLAASVCAARWAAQFFYIVRTTYFCEGRGSGSGDGSRGDSMWPFLRRDCKRTKGIPKTVGFWRHFCILLPPWAKGCRAGARNIPAGGKRAGRGCSPQSKNEKRAAGTPAPAGCATEAARNDPRPGRGIPFLHLTTKAQKIATQGQLFPPRVIVFRQAASKCALTGCLLSAFVCVILGSDSTNRKLWNRQAFYNRS